MVRALQSTSALCCRDKIVCDVDGVSDRRPSIFVEN